MVRQEPARCKPDSSTFSPECKSLDSLRLRGDFCAGGPGGFARLMRRENTSSTAFRVLRRYIARYSFRAQKIYRQYYHRRQPTPDWLDRSDSAGVKSMHGGNCG